MLPMSMLRRRKVPAMTIRLLRCCKLITRFFCLLAAVNGFATSVHAMSESADKTQAVLQGWISEHTSFSFSFLSHLCPCRCFRFSGLDRSLGNPSFPPVTIRPQTQARTRHESQASSVWCHPRTHPLTGCSMTQTCSLLQRAWTRGARWQRTREEFGG